MSQLLDIGDYGPMPSTNPQVSKQREAIPNLLGPGSVHPQEVEPQTPSRDKLEAFYPLY